MHHLNDLVQLFQQGRYSEILPFAEALIGTTPDCGGAYKMLGLAYRQLAEPMKALHILEQAERLIPEDPDLEYLLAVTFQDVERFEEAVAYALRAVTRNPNSMQAYRVLGDSLFVLRQFDEAADTYSQALRLTPQSAGDIEHQAAIESGLAGALLFIVQLWHVPMMNDAPRNTAYFNALQDAVAPETRALEIGTGSGLLAMMTAKLGAK